MCSTLLTVKAMAGLRRHLFEGNEKAALFMAGQIAQALLSAEYPELTPDVSLYFEVIEITSHKILIEAKRQLNLSDWDRDTADDSLVA